MEPDCQEDYSTCPCGTCTESRRIDALCDARDVEIEVMRAARPARRLIEAKRRRERGQKPHGPNL